MIHAPREQFLCVFKNQRKVRRILRAIDEFFRVASKIEEEGWEMREMNVLVKTVTNDVHRALMHRQPEFALRGIVGRIAEVELPMRLCAPVARLRAFQEWGQRLAVALHRRFGADCIHQSWHDVHILGERGHRYTAGKMGGWSRIADDERYVERTVEISPLADQPVVAQLLAVV